MSASVDLNERQRRVLAALRELENGGPETGGRWRPPFTAQDIAYVAGLPRVRRRGNGAVKGSWSGYRAPALSVTSTLAALRRRGLVRRYDAGRERYVAAYATTEEGKQ